MSTIRFAESHEWVSLDDDGEATVGISDFAQDALGDIVFIELPKIGTPVTAKQQVAVVESVKSVSEIYSPVSGDITAVNEQLATAPETLNAAAESDGWLYKIKVSDPTELESLMDRDTYTKQH